MTIRELAAKLGEQRLRPIIDHVLHYVVCDCPACHAQDTDPWGMWRPLRVVPRGRTITFLCTACNTRREVRCV